MKAYLYTSLMGFGILCLLVAGAILAFQVFTWLQTGIWPEYSLYKFVFWTFGEHLSGTWLMEPHSWYGAHKIVNWFLTFSHKTRPAKTGKIS